MSTSTNGQLCYGIVFPEGFSFPWDNCGEDDWWRKINGYKPPFELFTEEGEYINGIKPSETKIEEYFNHKYEWDKKHPFPVEVVNYCSDECPMYIIAIKGVFVSRRGYPEEINPAKLIVTEEQKQTLLNFCQQYLQEEIANEEILLEPRWYLTSYWG